jgi:PAS domain S-box-containing protein
VAGERILVVDDEKGVVRSCVRILQRQGFIVSGRTDSLSVPGLLRQETFDLLLTDIKMPKIDGLELLKIAKEIDPHLTVVIITGYGTMEDAITAIRFGAQGFLMKPFEPEDLVATVKDSLSRRALIRDSLRLQTLLPLLEINQILQVSGGEISLVRRVLDIAHRATGATRIAWLSHDHSPSVVNQKHSTEKDLIEAAVVPKNQRSSRLPEEAIATAQAKAHPIWVLADGTIMENRVGQPSITGALLPLIIKGEVAGILTAETGGDGQTGPFGQISLDLLSVVTGQLAIIIENVQLFQQTETLRTFNEDIIQNMTNGLIAVDKNNQITAFNPVASTMLGYHIHEVLHHPVHQVVGIEELTKVFNETLITGRGSPRQEITVQHRDGHCLPISVSTAPLGGQEPVGVVGVIEDLSEIKALEAKRRRLDRLAALGEMAAVVAHEIRNPVAGIAAGVEYLSRNAPEGSLEFEGAALIQEEIKRVNRILEDILFVARPLQLNLSYEDLSIIIKNVIQRSQPQIKESQIIVRCEHEENLPLLNVDGQRLEQVLSNLIINATQAMKNGGQILLETGIDSTQDGPGQEKVVITITDTGPGISVDVRQRIFEPFFTTKARGTGLGLSVARRIIEAHNGTISFESKEGQGTRFMIELPLE